MPMIYMQNAVSKGKRTHLITQYLNISKDIQCTRAE